MIHRPPITDLTRISIAGSALEHAVQRWIDENTLGRYTLDVPTIVEFVDFYTRLLAARKTIIKLSRLCSFECSNSPLVTRHSPLDTPPFDDLAPLHAVGAELERVVMEWVIEIQRCPDPDVPTIAEAIDIFTRLASARKTLIKLSCLGTPRPTRSAKSRTSDPLARRSDSPAEALAKAGGEGGSDPSDPVPAINIPQLPTISATPYDLIAPEYDFITAALTEINPEILSAPMPPQPSLSDETSDRSDRLSDPHDPQAPEDAQAPEDPNASHSPDPEAPPRLRDSRCIALNIHPALDDTSRVPDHHPWFDRTQYGHFNPRYLSRWNRKKFRRYG